MKTQTDEEDRQKSGVTSIYQMVLIEVVVVLLLLLTSRASHEEDLPHHFLVQF